MKVIDLLNKIANGGEILNKILVKGKIFEYNNSYESIEQLYRNDIGINWFDNIDINLNTEIEIIEEPKRIEKLDIRYDKDIEDYVAETYINGNLYKEIAGSKYDEMIVFKINEIINKINEMSDSNES